MPATNRFRVSGYATLVRYYDPPSRCWVGFYETVADGYQIGECWYAADRDRVLLDRPAVPPLPTALGA